MVRRSLRSLLATGTYRGTQETLSTLGYEPQVKHPAAKWHWNCAGMPRASRARIGCFNQPARRGRRKRPINDSARRPRCIRHLCRTCAFARRKLPCALRNRKSFKARAPGRRVVEAGYPRRLFASKQGRAALLGLLGRYPGLWKAKDGWRISALTMVLLLLLSLNNSSSTSSSTSSRNMMVDMQIILSIYCSCICVRVYVYVCVCVRSPAGFFLSFSILLPLILQSSLQFLPQFIQLSNLFVAELVKTLFVEFLSPAFLWHVEASHQRIRRGSNRLFLRSRLGLFLDRLEVLLPLGYKANDMCRVVNVSMSPEFCLDVIVSHGSHGRWQVPVRSQNVSVQC